MEVARTAGASAWLDALDIGGADRDPHERARLLAGVTVDVARHRGIVLPDLAILSRWGSPRPVAVPPDMASPRLLGAVHQHVVGRTERRRGGVFYTPPDMAATIARWAIETGAASRPVVCDPSVGAGSFLLAAGEELVRRGVPPVEAVADHLVGIDIDPVAASISEAALSLWAGGGATPRMIVGDALALPGEAMPARVDVVVGNPPFLNQLGRSTVRPLEVAAALRERFGPVAAGYVDTSALFLVLATRLVATGGAVAMVLPRSFLATRHTSAARRAVLADASLEILWLPADGGFAAAVQVCVPVLRKGGAGGEVRRFEGSPPRERHALTTDGRRLAAAATWSHLLADDNLPPAVPLRNGGTLGDLCVATADFRDQYYGMAPFVVDDPAGELDDASFPPLITSGLIDPAVCRWGHRQVRFHKRCWEAPRVDLFGLRAGAGLGGWDRRRLVPKVLVATQTRVIEAVVDEDGAWLPSTPVITVTASPARLWHVAAVLLAPAVAAWALREFGGAALSASAIKLSAAQVRMIPTPPPGEAWDEAAAAVRAATAADDDETRRLALVRAAWASCRAYGIDDPAIVEWWVHRLPTRP